MFIKTVRLAIFQLLVYTYNKLRFPYTEGFIMKKKHLIPLLLLSCIITGCNQKNNNTDSIPTSRESTSIEEIIETSRSETLPLQETLESSTTLTTEASMITLSPNDFNTNETFSQDSLLSFQNEDKTKLTYDLNRSEATIIQNVSDLNAYKNIGAFDKYDAAFFENSSLLLITQTTRSGSIGVSVDSISTDGQTLKIKLAYDVPDIGTADMATWLIWVEIDNAYNGYTCEIINPAVKSGLSVY